MWLQQKGEKSMFIDNGLAFAEARLRSRLLLICKIIDAADGPALAEATLSAITIDMRTAYAKPATLGALDVDALFDAAWNVREALHDGSEVEFTLPSGTTAVSRTPGSLRIGDAQYVLDAGRPGLHPVETTRQDAHGPNLERLRALIERRTRRLACRRLGLPGASSIVINDVRHNLQFPPCAEAGAVVLQWRASETGADRFCAATPGQLAAFADSIVRDMRELWKHREAIGARVNAVRQAAEAHILDEHGPGGPVSITAIAVELCGDTGDQPVSLYVEMDSMDEALRPGRTMDYVPARARLDEPWFRFNDNLASRTEQLAELVTLGADGRISDLAAAVADAAPEGRQVVLARLGSDLDAQVVIPTGTGDLYATLYWQNGFIGVEVSLPGHLETYSDQIELRATLPATVTTAMIGRPLGDVIALPFRLPAPVREVEGRSEGWLRITIDHRHSLVNCATGAIWPEPNDRHARAAAVAEGE